MSRYRYEGYDAQSKKTFRAALCRLLQTEFPGVFGPAITDLLAEKIEELFQRFYPPATRVKAGQVVWYAVSKDDPPSFGKDMSGTKLVPVILDLVTSQDVQDSIAGYKRRQIRRDTIARLFRQAFEQGGVLGHPDVALLTLAHPSTVSRDTRCYESDHHTVLPRRGTVHDMGRSVSHKAQICRKRLVENKTTSQVARETHHEPQSVEHYVQDYRRIKLCLDKGLTADQTALVTRTSLQLVVDYCDLIDSFESLKDKDKSANAMPP